MSYNPLGFEALRDEFLAETRNQSNGARVTSDTEEYKRASVLALAAAHIMYAIKYVERQIFPDTSDPDNLRRKAKNLEITEKPATIATGGHLELTGTNSTAVPNGLTGTHEDGTAYVTTSSGTIAGGVLSVTFDAVEAGAAPNREVGDELQVQSPPVGLDQVATVTAVFEEPGTDAETHAQLLERVLARMREGNQGGTHTDYEQWALASPGVYAAHCLPLRRGAGTVSVAVFTIASGRRAPAGALLRSSVKAELDLKRPVTADVDTPTVTQTVVDVALSAVLVEPGFDEAAVLAAVAVAVEDYIWSLETGDTLYISQLGRVIASVAGVRDYSIDLPATNTAAVVSGSLVTILTPGTITATP